MTVEDLIRDLKKADPKARVVFATGPGTTQTLDVLSIYSSDPRGNQEINKNCKVLFIDMG